jgi:hypothetical protein
MTHRRLIDLGLVPLVSYPLLLVGFIGLSLFLFLKVEFAPYIYVLVSLAVTAKLSETGRNDFLRLWFKKQVYLQIRLLENLIVTLPFVLFLLYKEEFLASAILLAAAALLSLNSFKTDLNITIPTPFYHRPFEFLVGFRSTYLLFPVAYGLTVFALINANFNLGIFSLLLVIMVVLSYYSQPEGEYIVWSFKLSPRMFLWQKMKTALIYTSMLCLPILTALGIAYGSELLTIMAVFAMGCLLLMMVILAKYAAYPHEMNLPEGVILALSVAFPPAMLVFAPFLYTKAVRHLNSYLG